jgi:NAD(P)-dependent dehydrogenase (short-subunit alcohol dehydrogenase family)
LSPAAARGIGEGVATALARAGFDIAILGLEIPAEAETVTEAVQRLGRRVLYVQHDIAEVETFRR